MDYQRVDGSEAVKSGTMPDGTESARLFAAIHNYAIFALDENGCIATWSAAAERLTGYSAGDVRGQPFSIFGPDRSGAGQALLKSVRETGSTAQDRWWRRQDGGVVWVREEVYPMADGGYAVMAHDLTERVELEERHVAALAREEAGLGRESMLRSELQSAERRAAFLAEASSILVATSLDFDTTVKALARLAVSRLSEWCVVHSLTEDGSLAWAHIAHRDPAVERRLEKALGSAPLDGWTHTVQSVISTGQPEILDGVPTEGWLEAAGEAGGGAGEAASVMITPLMGRGRVLGAITFVAPRGGRGYDDDDLALADELGRRAAIALDNARLYREAQEASRAKGDFLAVISHELRTPLNAIMGYSDLLDAEISGGLSDRQRRQVGRIRASARHLLQLIEEILSFARIEAGGEEIHPELADAFQVAEDAAAVIEPMALAKDLEFRVEAPPESVRLETDPGKVRQVLVNLLSNAVKFTERGSIVLRIRNDGRRVIYDIVDTGIGIPEAQQQRIFDPFWQAERPNTRTVGGTGLGLSVSRRYIRLLRGDLEIESEPGRGTRVSVLLPMRLTGTESTASG
ncbi:MAG TPA: ATP-binding protein [Longimicrobiales bacterium]|nr:ATP-binding protein [Longimicrobiales bacterium]